MIEPETPWDRAAVEQHEEHWSDDAEFTGTVLGVGVGFLAGLFIIAAGVGAWVAL